MSRAVLKFGPQPFDLPVPLLKDRPDDRQHQIRQPLLTFDPVTDETPDQGDTHILSGMERSRHKGSVTPATCSGPTGATLSGSTRLHGSVVAARSGPTQPRRIATRIASHFGSTPALLWAPD